MPHTLANLLNFAFTSTIICQLDRQTSATYMKKKETCAGKKLMQMRSKFRLSGPS